MIQFNKNLIGKTVYYTDSYSLKIKENVIQYLIIGELNIVAKFSNYESKNLDDLYLNKADAIAILKNLIDENIKELEEFKKELI